jgi:hypothetical protein
VVGALSWSRLSRCVCEKQLRQQRPLVGGRLGTERLVSGPLAQQSFDAIQAKAARQAALCEQHWKAFLHFHRGLPGGEVGPW